MGLEVYRMQSLNIDAARKLGQEEQANAESRAAAAATSLETPAPHLADTGTPYSLNTPDILNSLISITTNPFFDNIPMTSTESSSTTTNSNTTTTSTSNAVGSGENGSRNTGANGAGSDTDISGTPQDSSTSAQTGFGGNGGGGGGEEDRKVFATLEAPSVSAPSIPPPREPTSVQSMTSQLIKDSLKHTIQSKRKNSGKEDLDIKAELQAAKVRRKEEVRSGSGPAQPRRGQDLGAMVTAATAKKDADTATKLTPEDEERRRRRRERNKVAATKCRNKKKEKTGLLAIDAETLESSNINLKSEISQLEHEHRQLLEVLASHNSTCSKVHKPNARLPQIHPQMVSHHNPPTPAPVTQSFYAPHLQHNHNGYHATHPSIHPHLYHGPGAGVSMGMSGSAHLLHHPGGLHHAGLHQHHVVQSTIQL